MWFPLASGMVADKTQTGLTCEYEWLGLTSVLPSCEGDMFWRACWFKREEERDAEQTRPILQPDSKSRVDQQQTQEKAQMIVILS